MGPLGGGGGLVRPVGGLRGVSRLGLVGSGGVRGLRLVRSRGSLVGRGGGLVRSRLVGSGLLVGGLVVLDGLVLADLSLVLDVGVELPVLVDVVVHDLGAAVGEGDRVLTYTRSETITV